MNDAITIADKYGPAMKIREQAQADAYFALCVDHCMRTSGMARDAAERTERRNLGYYAGYHDRETRARVLALFNAPHPFFGTEEPTPQEALRLGFRLGQTARNRSTTK